jgi:hypothetical protein
MSRRHRKTTRSGEPDRSIPDLLYPTLDLHGLTEAEAVRLCETWIVARVAEGERIVRIVTGRGIHSAGLPVLPAAIEALLGGLRRGPVLTFEREPGGGAYRVQLTTKALIAPPPKSAAGQSGQIDVELVRLAEEALAELGIEPTPPLIEAEVLRIVKERDRERS